MNCSPSICKLDGKDQLDRQLRTLPCAERMAVLSGLPDGKGEGGQQTRHFRRRRKRIPFPSSPSLYSLYSIAAMTYFTAVGLLHERHVRETGLVLDSRQN